jgi:chemotaxis signal transduction protein
MTLSRIRTDDRAAVLREAFDRSFAEPATAAGTAGAGLLRVRIGSERYVIQLDEISGLFADKKITHLPSPVHELLGIAGFRGVTLPVYDLGMMLGHARRATPRWLVLTATTNLGLAFDDFEGYASALPGSILPAQTVSGAHDHVREVWQAEFVRPVIHLGSILETIKNRCGRGTQAG